MLCGLGTCLQTCTSSEKTRKCTREIGFPKPSCRCALLIADSIEELTFLKSANFKGRGNQVTVRPIGGFV